MSNLFVEITICSRSINWKSSFSESESDKKLTEIVKTILSNVGFILHLISGVFALLAYFIPYVMFPDYAKSKGLSTKEASMVITVSGISGMLNMLKDKKK